MPDKFHSIAVGDNFFVGNKLCKKQSRISYSVVGENFDAEQQYDPDDAAKVMTMAEHKAKNEPPQETSQKAVKPVTKKVAVKPTKKSPTPKKTGKKPPPPKPTNVVRGAKRGR